MGIEENLINQSLFQQNLEKTTADKILAKNDIENIRVLIKKKKLTREELLELLYLLSSSEVKLVSYSPYERYVQLKFFVWIREYVKMLELMYDYRDDLEQKEKKGEITISALAKQTLNNCDRLLEHNAKFLIDLYLCIMRTSLSVNAAGFQTLAKTIIQLISDKKETSPSPEKPKSIAMGEMR